MAIDFSVHGPQMQAAWKDVLNEKSDTNWALYGYDGSSNILKLVATGEDGVEELREEFNPNKIMYAFCRVEDPNTSLPKNVLINWQGESAPGTRKGTCAMHVRDVARYLAGSHLTVMARNEDEIDMDEIQQKVSKVTVSSFNFKEKPVGMEHIPEPVGTAHKRINPMQELPKMDDREKFWLKDQEEEKMRIVEERQKRVSEQRTMEEERIRREEKERRERDEQIKMRERKISQQREQEKKVIKEAGAGGKKWEDQVEEDMRDNQERKQRSEQLRKERTNEAKELISQRQGNARAIFERNSSQGQMNFRRKSSSGSVTAPPVSNTSPPAPAPAPANNTSVSKSATLVSPTSEDGDLAPPPAAFNEGATPLDPPEPSPQPDLIGGPAAPDIIASVTSTQPDIAAQTVDSYYHASPATVTPEPPLSPATPPNEATPTTKAASPPTNGDSPDSYGMCAVALYDYQAADETEISFDPGQIITHIDQIDPGWWQGLGPDGNYGLFPANYVDIIDNSELQVQ